MSDFIILGTDTDAGKTTFALLWMAAFGDRYAYWKPVETGDSDADRVRRLVPAAQVLPSLYRFLQPVAPPLAARLEGRTIPPAADLAAARPVAHPRRLVVETFGSPLSPLNETELQLTFVRLLALRAILVSSSAVGAVGRALQGLQALAAGGIHPHVVVLVGEPDDYAAEAILRHGPGPHVFQVRPPTSWDVEGVARAAGEQRTTLEAIAAALDQPPAAPAVDVAGIVERDRRSVWHPYTSLRDPDPPLVAIAARDEFLWLADGRRVIDGISSWWTILHGHRHPALVAALAAAAERLDHVHFAGVTHPTAVEAAERLLATVPSTGGRVFYSDNGSTAVEVALKLAYQFWCHRGEPGRTLFVGFEGGYHGDTFGAMAVGRDPVFFGRFEPLLFRALTVPLSADRLDAALAAHRGRVAAVIVEPLVQGAGGMRMHSADELRDLAAAAARHDVLFIADEVMTGGGRTGPLWAHQAAGVAPDLICAAKTLAGGLLPLAATLASPRLTAAWDTDDRRRTFFHGHSFTGHPLACAVAVANLRLLPPGPNPQAVRMESFWRQALEPLRGRPGVKDVRVRGSIAAVELDEPGGYLADVGRRMRHHCLARGVLLRPLGPVLYALPPLGTSDDSLAQIADTMKDAVTFLPPG
jgi:adenosylmethionine---8-amino-7-oxononanoate aminotransferase